MFCTLGDQFFSDTEKTGNANGQIVPAAVKGSELAAAIAAS